MTTEELLQEAEQYLVHSKKLDGIDYKKSMSLQSIAASLLVIARGASATSEESKQPVNKQVDNLSPEKE